MFYNRCLNSQEFRKLHPRNFKFSWALQACAGLNLDRYWILLAPCGLYKLIMPLLRIPSTVYGFNKKFSSVLWCKSLKKILLPRYRPKGHMKWFKIVKEQCVYLKLALISFWTKFCQNWQNGGHLKKKNYKIKFKLRTS